MSIELNNIRSMFPAFDFELKSGRLAYLDSAASAQKPRSVIDRMNSFMAHEYANIQRGAYELSAQASLRVEEARLLVKEFISALSEKEIIFTKSATDALNMISFLLTNNIAPGSNLLISTLEHHSNIVPWQLASERNCLKLHFVPITDDADFDYDAFKEMLKSLKPKVVALTHLSNAFGTPVRIAEIAPLVHEHGGILVVDCAQSVVHQKLQVANLGADFIAFSGHKLYGPTGIGVLWGKQSLLETLSPYQGGGGMIEHVSISGSTWAALPQRFLIMHGIS
jgi:selenocysteine lyase/cysteine desulfurase